jgi:hypothetical protein
VLSRFTAVALSVLASGAVHGRGVSPYLPLNQSPEYERLVERVMILADKPIITRPITAAAVFDALPAACELDAALCAQVERYLSGYMKTAGISHASFALATSSTERTALPNRHGMLSDSGFEASIMGYWQPSDFLLLSAGVLAYDDEAVPTGSVISIGMEYAQLDIGYRDHWMSPMTDSAMLQSTQMQTMPSVTLSNYTPLTPWRLRYEFFIAEMSHSDRIRFEDGFTSGNPRLAGMHISLQPFAGWSIGFNRIMQYGGGERPDSFSDLWDAFFDPAGKDNASDDGTDFGNQAASITSRLIIPAASPFSVYFEYAGEDTSKSSNFHLGNASLSGGIYFPALWQKFDLTVEISEWQNGWYVNGIYLDGLRHEGNVVGHWGGDWRELNDAVGANSFMTRLGWQMNSGAIIDATYRTLDNESYTTPDYERAHALQLRYSRTWSEFFVGAELDLGSDVFGGSYTRISGFIRF